MQPQQTPYTAWASIPNIPPYLLYPQQQQYFQQQQQYSQQQGNEFSTRQHAQFVQQHLEQQNLQQNLQQFPADNIVTDTVNQQTYITLSVNDPLITDISKVTDNPSGQEIKEFVGPE